MALSKYIGVLLCLTTAGCGCMNPAYRFGDAWGARTECNSTSVPVTILKAKELEANSEAMARFNKPMAVAQALLNSSDSGHRTIVVHGVNTQRNALGKLKTWEFNYLSSFKSVVTRQDHVEFVYVSTFENASNIYEKISFEHRGQSNSEWQLYDYKICTFESRYSCM